MSFELYPLRPRTVSQSVRDLHGVLSDLLNDTDRQVLIRSLNQYQKDRNVKNLAISLKSVLNTPRKREVYPLLRQIIPANDQSLLDRIWHHGLTETRQQHSTSPNRQQAKKLSRYPTSISLPEKLNKYASADSGIELPNDGRPRALTTRDKYPIKRLVLKRSSSGFGFCIRGGAEHGVGLYVSSVDRDSVADREGLLTGDHILLVNETKVDGLTHAQAVSVSRETKC